ncbi:MAG: phosphoribosylglycinamide formyltransferase [Defluviitaleaceae bacterium]|nr:phosphoribosylglycinamide formyltransferase [Defluviitaleaceae bacterium]
MGVNIAVFASGGGSDMQAIINACEAGQLNAQVCVVISNKKNATALERAKNHGIPAFSINHANAEKILATLQAHDTQLIFLAGYLRLLPENVLSAYENNILNIHPSMLPKYGGRGMYGINVHTAVLAAGETETGITIHRVNQEYDKGEIIAQRRVPVKPGDTPETLAARVLQEEHIFIVQTLAEFLPRG